MKNLGLTILSTLLTKTVNELKKLTVKQMILTSIKIYKWRRYE